MSNILSSAVVSYNKYSLFPSAGWRSFRVDSQTISRVLVLPGTFNPKGPESVRDNDPNWTKLVQHRDELDRIVIFAGKLESGALEIIQLAFETFSSQMSKILFVLCDHGLAEKRSKLTHLGFRRENWFEFEDCHLPCREWRILLGHAALPGV